MDLFKGSFLKNLFYKIPFDGCYQNSLSYNQVKTYSLVFIVFDEFWEQSMGVDLNVENGLKVTLNRFSHWFNYYWKCQNIVYQICGVIDIYVSLRISLVQIFQISDLSSYFKQSIFLIQENCSVIFYLPQKFYSLYFKLDLWTALTSKFNF